MWVKSWQVPSGFNPGGLKTVHHFRQTNIDKFLGCSLKLELITYLLFSKIMKYFKVYGDTKGTNACQRWEHETCGDMGWSTTFVKSPPSGILWARTKLFPHLHVRAGTEPCDEICCRPKSENGKTRFALFECSNTPRSFPLKRDFTHIEEGLAVCQELLL